MLMSLNLDVLVANDLRRRVIAAPTGITDPPPVAVIVNVGSVLKVPSVQLAPTVAVKSIDRLDCAFASTGADEQQSGDDVLEHSQLLHLRIVTMISQPQRVAKLV